MEAKRIPAAAPRCSSTHRAVPLTSASLAKCRGVGQSIDEIGDGAPETVTRSVRTVATPFRASVNSRTVVNTMTSSNGGFYHRTRVREFLDHGLGDRAPDHLVNRQRALGGLDFGGACAGHRVTGREQRAAILVWND